VGYFPETLYFSMELHFAIGQANCYFRMAGQKLKIYHPDQPFFRIFCKVSPDHPGTPVFERSNKKGW
jgi:hypothetical protein